MDDKKNDDTEKIEEIVPDAGTWERTDDNIRWSMRDGNADAGGRAMMIHAAKQNNVSFMGEFKDGFHRTQASGSARAMFDACAREDQGRVYAIGRKYI